MTDTSTIPDSPEMGGAPKQAADLPDVDTLFPAEKPDVDELFPASVEQDWRRQQMGSGWVQDALFGEKKYDNARSIVGAFGSTFKEAVGEAPFGLTPETEKVLRDHGVFNDYSLGQNSILKSINEDVIRPAAVGLDALWRSWNAMLPATQSAIMKTGDVRGFPHLARDIAGVPEAYMGIAHPGELPKAMPEPGAPVRSWRSTFGFPDVREARELGVIGEGERGWKGEPTAVEGETKPQTGPGADGATVLPEINVPAEPDLHAEARALKPELFSEYDKLAQERDTFREWISDLSEEREGEADLLRRAQIDKQIERVEGELAKTAPRLEELAPQVKEAYAAARDQAGLPKLPAEPPVAAEPVEPGAPVEPAPPEGSPAAPTEPPAEPFSIAKDTESRLVAAGRPAEEARLHAAWTEAYWQQYAKRFKGRKGTAEEAYRRDAAEILGEDEDKLQRKAERAGQPAPRINEEKLSLVQFLAHKGGLKQTGDLAAIFNGNPFVPRFGRLFREGGMSLDRAREAAVEAGYIDPKEFIGRAGGENTTRESDLLNALQEESGGRKVYRPGQEPPTPFDADVEAHERSIFEDRQEAAEPHEAEGAFEALPDQTIWDRFMAERGERRANLGVGTGQNDTLGRGGAPMRGAATQGWEPGNVVDVGFVKNLLVTEAHADGSFTLLARPDDSGMSQSYNAKPHEGLGRQGKVDFREAARPLWREEARASDPLAHLSEDDRMAMEELFQIPGIHIRGTAPGNELFQIDAHHGSPHDFDKFDIDRVGTGEGAGAALHGLWLSHHPDVAEGYRTTAPPSSGLYLAQKVLEREGSREAAIAYLAGDEATLPRSAEALRYLRDPNWNPGGTLYRTVINTDQARLLDVDLNLSDQSAGRALKERFPDLPENGMEAYQELASRLGGNASVSSALREMGIPGVSFIGEHGHRNFVIFDDSLIQVTHKNGKPVSASEAEAARQHIKEDSEKPRELFQRDEIPESHEAGRRNAEGFILRLPYADRWGDPRFNPEDRTKALARMAEIEKMPVKTAPWANLVQAKRDLDEIIAQLLYYRPETPIHETLKVSDVEYELYLRRKAKDMADDGARSHFDVDSVPDDIRDIVTQARAALDHLVDTDRRGVDDLLKFGMNKEPRASRQRGMKPDAIADTLPSGFHSLAGRKLADVPDALFPQGGWAVINWLRQEGVTVSEVQHFLLDEKLGNKKPVTREDFQRAIADRMFDFKRKTSWLNPERSPNDYDQGGTRAFTGPRVPGRGIYFERLMAFPKKLKGGEDFAPGQFESPHWEDVHKGTWASWRGSVREVPDWGRMVLGEEGQSDFMQGASSGKRPRISAKEFLDIKAERGRYEKVIADARSLADSALSHLPDAERAPLENDLRLHRFDRSEWPAKFQAAKEQVEASSIEPAARGKSLQKFKEFEVLHDANREFFEPGARGKYSDTGSTFTPGTPIDETYVRTMVRDLVMQAIKEKADSIAISTSETTGRVQNNAKAAHFYDEQLRPALQRELRRLTGDPSIKLEQVKLPKPMGAPRNEKPYTVWAAKLDPEVREGATEQGFPLFQKGDKARGKIDLRGDGRSAITLFRKESQHRLPANASTFIHESAHDFLHRMMRDARDAESPEELKADAQATLDWLGVKRQEDIKRRHHEKFARGFEAYMMEGRAPNQGMARVFARIREFMVAIYKHATALNVELSPEIRGVFDRLVGVNPDEVVITPDMAKAETLADVHEADAAHATPHQAHAVANTVRSERDSHAVENLIEEEHERTPDVEEGTGDRPQGGPEVHGNVDEPEVQPGEAGGHPPAGTERAGGGDAPEAGAGVPGDRGAAGGGQVNTEPPAGAHVAFDTPPTDMIDKAGNIRLDKLDTPEDVKQVLRDVADAHGGFVESRRGVMSDAEVLGLADALGMDAASLNRRRIGQAFSAEQIVAARKLLIQSATTVRDAMIKAAEGTEADLLAYAEAKARHVMIQEQVAGITAEAGRALRAFRQMAGAKEAAIIGDFLKASTGQTLFQLQREARLGKQLADPAQVSKFIHDSTKPTFSDMVLEYWINGLISGPATHTTYAVGNALLALWKAGPETAAASLIGIARRAAGSDGPRVMAGEVPAQLFGMMKGMRQGVIAAYESAKSGQTSLLPGELQAMSMSQQAMSPMLNPKAMIPGPVGTLVRLPARGVAIIHSFFRAVNYQREMAALAYRTAGEEGLTGPAFASRVGEVMTNPDAGLMEQARASATDLTLMGKGGELTKAASALTNATFLGAQWLKFVAPFVHIGSNVLEQALLQRTLLGVLDPEIRSSLMGVNGPIARDTAIARMAVGSALGVAVGSLAAEGLINGSGPSDPREKALWMMVNGPPHSVRVGDTWYDIHRLGPLGMLVGVTADMYEVAQHLREEGLDNKSAALVARAFTENILDESWMNGPAELIKALSDPDRYGERWVRNFASSFTPYSVGSSQIARAIDPYSRQARSTVDAIKAKIPWLSQTLLPRRDIFGEPIASKDALGLPGLSAIYEAKVNNDPTIRAMLDAKFFPGMPQHKIRGVELTDQQYDDFVRISGRLGKQRLDEIARMQSFSELPEGVRMEMMRKSFDGAREMARTQVMMQNPNILRDAIDAKKAKLTGKKPETAH